jgi:predicted DNA-binding transcriptional regulator YafY
MRGDGDYEVVIEFDEWATDLLQGRHWHSSQKVVPLPGGGSHMHLRLSGLEEVERWVLSWGVHATVIGPAALSERIGKTVAALGERYRDC